MAQQTGLESGDLLSLISSLTNSLGQVRDAIKDADATIAALAGAPTSSSYVSVATESALSAERVLTGTSNEIAVTDGGANTTVTLSIPSPFVLDSTAGSGTGAMRLDAAAFSATANQDIARLHIDNTNAITIPAGTTTLAAALAIDEPNLVATGTITNTATLYIGGAASEGTNDYALWVDSGTSRFDGSVLFLNDLDIQFQDGGGTARNVLSLTSADNVEVGRVGELQMFSGNAQRAILDSAGSLLIGDTANAKMTIGLTINQGANDDEAIALKSSDVAHSFTALAEADTYGTLHKAAAASGGLRLRGYSTNATNGTGVLIQGFIPDGGVDDTTTTAGEGIISLSAAVDDDSTSIEGLSVAAVTGNLLVVRDNVLTQFIVKEDGEIASNLAATVYDAYPDIDIVRAFSHVTSPKEVIRDRWDAFVTSNEQTLVELGILGAPLDQHPLYSVTKLQMLHNGAIWQLYTKHMDLLERHELLAQRFSALEGPKDAQI